LSPAARPGAGSREPRGPRDEGSIHGPRARSRDRRRRPFVVRMLKRAVYQGSRRRRHGGRVRAFCQAITFGSADLQEGLAAARGSAAPTFEGQ
jgi:IS5 family transposase